MRYNRIAMSRWEAYLRQEVIGAVVRRVPWLIYAAAWLWRRLLVRTTFIAVSGSLGKTTTKELLAEMLASHAPTYRTWRNQNSRSAVALNILRVRPWHRYAVLEVEAGSPGAMDRPAAVVAPDLTVMICIAGTHTTVYEDLDAHAREKVKIVRATRKSGVVILNADDPRVAAMESAFPGRVRRFRVGPMTGESPAQAATEDVITGTIVRSAWPDRLSLKVQGGALPLEGTTLVTQLVGAHWAHAALGAMAAALAVGAPLDAALAAARKTPPFPGRLCPVQSPSGAIFLRDDYNASATVLDASLAVLRDAKAKRRILVLTDFSDFGANRRQRLKFLAARLAESAEAFVLVGRDADYGARRAAEAGLDAALVHPFATLEEASRFLKDWTQPGDLVLVKGRTTDHAARLVLAQFADVACWKEYCPKRMLCDICWEVGPAQPALLRIRALSPAAVAETTP
jgi:UDP-N-acetylmuramoyl-tripeptide--D-alanyl-D-alanine ligase